LEVQSRKQESPLLGLFVPADNSANSVFAENENATQGQRITILFN
jgi:hypothetical protein